MAFGLSRVSQKEWLNEVFEPFFNSTINDLMSENTFFQGVPAQLSETPEAYKLCIEVPGMSRKDIQLELEDNVLIVQGKLTNKSLDTINAKSFYKTYVLPKDAKADKVKASCKNGVLQINIPKVKRNTRVIPISANIKDEIVQESSTVVKTTWWQRIKNQFK